jgi:hypothetical protein
VLARRCFIALVAATGLAGCATLPDGSRWGEHADFTPGWQRVGDAAVTALKSPSVWLPVAGAATLQIDNWDHRISDSAIKHTSVFGSTKSAADASDTLQLVALGGYAATVLATPGGEAGSDWWLAKAKGGLVGLAAIGANQVATDGLKALTNRERPNGDSGTSFPSGHTSFAAVNDRLASRNLDDIPMNDVLRTSLQVGTEGITIATGWARVEAGEHYPSDVLVGMALGNFFGIMFDEAFLGGDRSPQVSLSIAPVRGGAEAMWGLRF